MPGSPAMRKARAEMLLGVYLALGPDRSIERVREISAASGLSVGVTTLKSYSAEYGWVAKAQAFDEERGRQNQIELLAHAAADDARLQREAEAFRAIGIGAVRKVSVDLQRPDGELPLAFLAAQAARWWETGFKAQRLIAGQATERVEISVEIWERVMRTTQRIFTEHVGAAVVEIERDPSRVREAFAILLDQLGAALDESIADMLAASGVQLPGRAEA